MPTTVNIERHKLNQAMYQKLKRYIMSKRKRELEEKAEDDRSKRLRREREERKKQAEEDAENLENTRKELSDTRKKIQELTAKQNELFHRWKQLGIEESNLKDKQKQESISLLTSMPTTQFGLGSSALSDASRPPPPSLSHAPRSHTPGQLNPHSLPPTGKAFVPNTVHNVTLAHAANHQSHVQFPNLTSQSNVDLPTAHHRTAIPSSPSQKLNLPSSAPALTPGFGQLSNPSLSSSPAVSMTAALAAQHRSASEQPYSPTAAAAAYLNAIASLTSNGQNPLTNFGSTNPLALLNATNPAGLAEIVASLAASGIYPLPTTSAAVSNNNALVSTLSLNVFAGHRDSPAAVSLSDISFSCSSSQADAALTAAFIQQSASGITKGYNTTTNNNNTNNGRHASSAPSVSGATLPPAPISYRGSITTGQSAQQIQLQQQQLHHQQQVHQKQQQMLSKYSDLASVRSAAQQLEGSVQHGRSSVPVGRFPDAAALMASIGVSTPSAAMFNAAAALQSGLASSMAATSTTTIPSASSPIALTAMLAPYAAELKQLHLLATLQQQQPHQKQTNSAHCSPSPRLRVSPANSVSSSTTPGSHASSATGGRHFF